MRFNDTARMRTIRKIPSVTPAEPVQSPLVCGTAVAHLALLVVVVSMAACLIAARAASFVEGKGAIVTRQPEPRGEAGQNPPTLAPFRAPRQ